MAWSDAARRASAEARRRRAKKLLYEPDNAPGKMKVGRIEMAQLIRKARATGLRGPNSHIQAIQRATAATKDRWSDVYTELRRSISKPKSVRRFSKADLEAFHDFERPQQASASTESNTYTDKTWTKAEWAKKMRKS